MNSNVKLTASFLSGFLLVLLLPRTEAQFMGKDAWEDMSTKMAFLQQNHIDGLSSSLRHLTNDYPFLQSDGETVPLFTNANTTGMTVQKLADFLCTKVDYWTRMGLTPTCARAMNDYSCELNDWFDGVNCTKFPSNSTECKQCERDRLARMTYHGSWPLQVMDAIGKAAPGVAYMDVNWMGSYNQCKRINVPMARTDNKRHFVGSYCAATFELPPVKCLLGASDDRCAATNHTVGDLFLQEKCSVPKAPLKLQIGFCFPTECNTHDAALMADSYFLSRYPNYKTPETHTVKARCTDYDRWNWAAISAICYFAIVLFMVVAGGFYDQYYYLSALNDIEENMADDMVASATSEKTADTEESSYDLQVRIAAAKKEYYDDLSLFAKIGLCFSFVTNGKKLFAPERPDMIPVILGMRLLSFMWVLLGNTYHIGMSYLRNNVALVQFPQQFIFQIVNNFTPCVDTFFVMNGCMLTYTFLTVTAYTNGKDLKSVRHWVLHYVRKYFRVIPVYWSVILFATVVHPHIGNGPFWTNYDVGIVKNCPQKFWHNMFFISNLIGPYGEQCLGHGWYVATDMQFYLAAPILLLLYWKWPKFAVGFSVFVMSFVMFLVGYIVVVNDYPPTLMAFGTTKDPGGLYKATIANFMTIVYSKPWLRCGPYIIGMFVGYVLYKTRGKLRMNGLEAFLAWAFTVFLTAVVIFSVYGYSVTGEMRPTIRGLYAATNRNLWAVAAGLVIYLCTQGYGGIINSFMCMAPILPLSRITFVSYLIHQFVLTAYYQTLRKPIYGGHVSFLYYYLSFFSVVYSFAVFGHLMFEAPIIQLETLILSRKSAKVAPGDEGKPLRPSVRERLLAKIRLGGDRYGTFGKEKEDK